MDWNDLDISSKAELIKLYVQNGIYNLDTIKAHYNQSGGKLTFEQWKSQMQSKYPDIEMDNNKAGYDYETYFKNHYNDAVKQLSNLQHFPDTYKLPNHPTFSNESIYSRGPVMGGSWNNNDTFTPSVINRQTYPNIYNREGDYTEQRIYNRFPNQYQDGGTADNGLPTNNRPQDQEQINWMKNWLMSRRDILTDNARATTWNYSKYYPKNNIGDVREAGWNRDDYYNTPNPFVYFKGYTPEQNRVNKLVYAQIENAANTPKTEIGRGSSYMYDTKGAYVEADPWNNKGSHFVVFAGQNVDPAVKIHEFTHASHPTQQEDYIRKVIFKDRDIPQVTGYQTGDNKYNAKELYGALQEFRYKNKLNPKQKITLKWVKEHKDLFKGNYLNNISDEDKVRLFNEVAQNNTQDNTSNYAANGGTLGKITPYGQWQYPHQVTTIPSNNITMQGVNYPVLGVSNTGDTKLMLPWLDYNFNGNYVTEYPLSHKAQDGRDLMIKKGSIPGTTPQTSSTATVYNPYNYEPEVEVGKSPKSQSEIAREQILKKSVEKFDKDATEENNTINLNILYGLLGAKMWSKIPQMFKNEMYTNAGLTGISYITDRALESNDKQSIENYLDAHPKFNKFLDNSGNTAAIIGNFLSDAKDPISNRLGAALRLYGQTVDAVQGGASLNRIVNHPEDANYKDYFNTSVGLFPTRITDNRQGGIDDIIRWIGAGYGTFNDNVIQTIPENVTR
jgi:hypothetical protein